VLPKNKIISFGKNSDRVREADEFWEPNKIKKGGEGRFWFEKQHAKHGNAYLRKEDGK